MPDDTTQSPPSSALAAARVRVLARQQRLAAERQAQAEARSTSRHLADRIRRLPPILQGPARSSLDAWDAVKGREGTRPAFRVGQVDTELLDEELLELLRGQVRDGLKYFGSHISQDYTAEISLALRAILFKLSIWDHDASYGAVMQGLRYTDARHKGPVLKAPSRWQKAVYGLVTVTGSYAWTKWEDWLINQEADYREPSLMARRLSRLTGALSTTHSVAALLSFLSFLVNGRYRTILDRVLRMRLAAPSSQISREVSFEYLNRQLVWHAFTEFLLFLLPLVGIGRWRRWLSRAWRKTKGMIKRGTSGEEMVDEESAGELSFLPERTCAICYQDQNPTAGSEQDVLAASSAMTGGGGVIGSAQTDITNPYETVPCGHVYCFVCLASRIEAEDGEGWTCLRCGEPVKECKPWSGDVVEEVSRPSTSAGKSVRFEDVRIERDGGEDESEDETIEGESFEKVNGHKEETQLFA